MASAQSACWYGVQIAPASTAVNPASDSNANLRTAACWDGSAASATSP